MIDTRTASFIDNLSFNYHHFAADYKVGKGSVGCASCGLGSSGGAGLMELLIERRHRFRNLTEYGSFGPGVYTNYDTKLFLNEVDGGHQIDVFDPRELWPLRLVDGINGDTLDGIFVDQRNKSVKEARLFDDTDTLTTDLDDAAVVEITAYSGEVHRFEVIDLAGNTVADDGLVGHWEFNTPSSGSTAEDSSTENHDGTIVGATRVTTSGAPIPGGTAGGSVDFDGVDDYITLGSPTVLNIAGKITMSAWIKPDTLANDTTGDGIRNIVCHVVGDNTDSTWVALRIWNGEYQAGTWSQAAGYHVAAATAPVGDVGQWVHLAGVYDGSTWRLYRNGQLIGSSQSQTGSQQSIQDWRIGSGEIFGTSRHFFDGEIDDVRIYSRNVLESEIVQLAEQRVLAGRLTKITDRNGYSKNVAYKSWTQAQIDASPERQWQMDTVTDPYGRSASFTYKSTQVSGQWVVEKIDLPNSQDVDYEYADGLHLTKAVHADGTESTFAYGTDTTAQATTVTIDDAAATGTHRNKKAYLTNNIFIHNDGAEAGELYNQSSMQIRMLENGTGEVAYLNFADTSHNLANKNLVYEGAGKMRLIHGVFDGAHYKDGWALTNPSQGFNGFSGNLESTYATLHIAFTNSEIIQTGVFSWHEDDQGVRYSHLYDADTFETERFYYPGNTRESWDYNGFKQVTKYMDRLGRETIKTYDANGNMTSRKVGVINGVDQPEVATYTKSYYNGTEGPAVSGITGAATTQPVGLLKSETDANNNTTHYVYNDDNFLIAVIQPADRVGDDRAIKLYEYDSSGRLFKSTDPLGRETSFAYDTRDRIKTVTYEDGSTEVKFYANELSGGAGSDGNLIVAMKDRNDNYTQYRYDGHGRRVTTIRGITTQSDALNQSFIPDETYHDVEECTYLNGTNLKTICIRNGERTEYEYDFRQRLINTTVYPREEGVFPNIANLIDPDGAGPLAAGDDTGALVSQTVYLDNLRFASVDSYGRASFYAYRASDSAMIRTIKETVPGGSGIDLATGTFTDVINLTRDLSFEDAAALGATDRGGAAYLITDMVKDNEGQATSTVDPRNIQHDTDFDSRGRVTDRTVAVGTADEATSQTVYDAQSNVIEQRSARYFDAGDTEGFNKAYTTMTYTGRNLLATRTVAAGDSTYDAFVTSGGTTGLGAKATEEMFYYLDGRHEKTIDYNGKDPQFTATDHEWITVWRQCCERVRATIDPDGHGQAQGHDFNGNVAHTAVVDSLINDVVIDVTTGARTITDSDFGGPGIWDVPDSRTLAETTTRFDSKNRPVASTVWLEPLDLVDPNDPPILYGASIQGGTNAQTAASGLGRGDGLTTLYYYSENIYELPVVTAGVEGPPARTASEDNSCLVHQFTTAPAIDLMPTLNKLDADGIKVFRDDYTNASARATINPEGEVSLTIMDGLGRPVISAMLHPKTSVPITWSTTSYDRVSNAISTTFGDTLETLSISALDNLNRSFVDGVGRTVETEDAEGEIAFAVYDNSGNQIRSRDANDVGQDCDFDARGRLTSCEDTQGDTVSYTYNDNNQVLKTTDAKSVANATDTVFDARGRVIKTTSRLAIADTNEATYDPNSNLLTQTDAEGGTTEYEYNPRNLRTATLMPGHNPTSVIGDSDYDRAEMTYDAMRRPLLKTDQLGDTCVFTYDLASRLLTRQYRTAANSTPLTNGLPTGTITDTDTFTYDAASRPLTAHKGRYVNRITFTYDVIGRPASETLMLMHGGVRTPFTVNYTAYDDDSRLTTLTYPDGSTVTTTFTPRNQAEDVNYTPSGGSASTIATHTYDAGMRLTLRDHGNGLETDFDYREDNLADTRDNMLASLTVETAPGNDDRQGLSFDYTYDANKNMTAEDTGGVMDDYGVDLVQDAKDRMTSWTRDTTNTSLDSQSWSLSFESDWDDTTLTDGGTGTTQTRTHNAPHELLTIDPDGAGGLPSFSQTHDSKGNLTADGDGLSHTYDFDNHLSQVVVGSSSPRGVEGTHTYKYDALGRRVTKSVTPTLGGSTTTTVFVHAGQQVLTEYTTGGVNDPERKYIYCSTCYIDDPIALIDASGSSEDTYYYHRNRQYTVIGLTDDTGTVIERYAYTAYGETTVLDANGSADADNVSDVLNPYTYTGRRLDDETGLHYFRARYHDAVLGRFLQRDPLGYPDGLNTYAAYHVMGGGVDYTGTKFEYVGVKYRTRIIARYSGSDVGEAGDNQRYKYAMGAVDEIIDYQLGSCKKQSNGCYTVDWKFDMKTRIRLALKVGCGEKHWTGPPSRRTLKDKLVPLTKEQIKQAHRHEMMHINQWKLAHDAIQIDLSAKFGKEDSKVEFKTLESCNEVRDAADRSVNVTVSNTVTEIVTHSDRSIWTAGDTPCGKNTTFIVKPSVNVDFLKPGVYE